VEEELPRGEAARVGVLDEAVCFSGEVVWLVVAEGPILVPTVDPLAPNRLLADRAGHLGQVEHRSAGTGVGHDDGWIVVPEVLVGDVPGVVTRTRERLHNLHLEGLVDRPAGETLEFVVLVGLDQLFDAVVGVVDRLVDARLGFPGMVSSSIPIENPKCMMARIASVENFH